MHHRTHQVFSHHQNLTPNNLLLRDLNTVEEAGPRGKEVLSMLMPETSDQEIPEGAAMEAKTMRGKTRRKGTNKRIRTFQTLTWNVWRS